MKEIEMPEIVELMVEAGKKVPPPPIPPRPPVDQDAKKHITKDGKQTR